GRVLRGRGCPVTEGPAVGTDRAVRVAARAGEAAGEPAAARRERGRWRLVRLADGDAMRGGAGRALIVGHLKGDGVGPPGRVRAGRVLGRRGRAVAEGPAVGADRAVGVAARAREATSERRR